MFVTGVPRGHREHLSPSLIMWRHHLALLSLAALALPIAAFSPAASSLLAPAASSLLVPRSRPALALLGKAQPPCSSTAPFTARSGAARSPATRLLFGPDKQPVETLRTALLTTGWLSWWAQAILSTISGVLLLFANSVSSSISTFALVGRAFALGGLGCAIASTLWTWSYARLAKKLGRTPDAKPADAAEKAMGIVRFGITLNMAGMLLCIVGAEAIVGTLAAKALTMSQSAALGVAASPVQALDMLIVQANTNIIFSHFVSLAACMRMRAAAKACDDAVKA